MARVLIAAVWIACSSVVSAQMLDRVRFDVPVSEAGVLVDGRRLGFTVNDIAYTSHDLGGFLQPLFPSVVLDNFTSSAGSNEVIAFGYGHAPTLVENVPWSPTTDTVDVDLEPVYRIPVHVYVVKGPFTVQRNLAAEQGIETARIFRDERLGIEFDSYDIVDRTQLASAPMFHDFNCELAESMRQQIGFVPGAINIYYVSRTLFEDGYLTTSGVHCGNGTIAMSRNTTGPLLAHEIGHALSLAHPDALTSDFDTSNVMWQSSNDRAYFTEGQTFRAVFDLFSDLNTMYSVRDGQVVRDCPHLEDTPICPTIEKRIWRDGNWGPN